MKSLLYGHLSDMWINTGGEGGLPLGLSQKERKKLYPLKGGIIDERRSQLLLKKKLIANTKNIVLVAPSDTHNSIIKKAHSTAQIKTIYNGIDLKTFNISGVAKWKNSIPKILLFYTLSIYKNSTQILAAYESVNRPFELHVIGKNLINDKISNIKNHGYIVDRNKLAELFKTIDIACFSSKAETFGLLPAELAACGTKVFLNKSLPVFKEHSNIYGAVLFDNEIHLKELIEESLTDIDQTRIDGNLAAHRVDKYLDRNITISSYMELYTQILNEWNNE